MITWDEMKELIQGILLEDTDITLETDLVDDLDFDSIDVMNLLNEIETRWEVDFTDLDDFASRMYLCKSLLEGVNELYEIKNQEDRR